MKVLLVEDDGPLAQEIAGALRRENFAVDIAADGEDGHHLGDTEAYDVAVLDLAMPGRGGLDVLKWARSQPTLVTVPIVVLISDIRRGLTPADEILIGFAPTSIPLTVILTKADKLGHGARQTARLQVLAQLKTLGRTANVLLLSNLTRLGLEDAQALVESWIKGE